MNADDRQVVEGFLYQGVDEVLIYSLTTTNWASSPTSPVVKAYDITDSHSDVSSTVLEGSPSVSGDVITLPKVKSLTEGHRYRIEVQFTISSVATPFEAYVIIVGQR